MRRSTLATALLLLVQADGYQILTTQGATCEPGLEITDAADCEAAIAEANAEIGKSTPNIMPLVDESVSYMPKGCRSTIYGGSGNAGYWGGHLNSHSTGSGALATDPENDQYVHCLPGTVAPTIPHPDCTTACGDPGWSNTGAPAVAGRCYKCYSPSGTSFNCPSADYRYDGNGLLLQKDECCGASRAPYLPCTHRERAQSSPAQAGSRPAE